MSDENQKPEASVDEAAEAKRKAAAEAREARARERAAQKQSEEPEEPKAPSPNQPQLDRIVEILKENVDEGAVEEAYINERDGHRPVLVVNNAHWRACATILKEHTELGFNYLRNVTGVDYETFMEVDYFLLSLLTKQECMVKIRTNRESPVVASATPVWATANWNEREIYDLLGIAFTDHPDLRRIMMPDDWIGHPLRKDYEPYDPEV